MSEWVGREVVITEKMDGENTTLYRDGLHARSLDSRHHPSRNWVKQRHGEIAYLIPDGWRICGENLYAKHSIFYNTLPGYFLMFSIWNAENACLSWEETLWWAKHLNLHTPKVLYQGVWDEILIKQLHVDTEISEGYVVRSVDRFKYTDFVHHVAKWVRPAHVQTQQHWMHAEVIPNQLENAS